MHPALRAAAHALERFLIPNACVGCDRVVEPHAPDALLCGVCRSRLRPLTGGCARCRQPLPPIGPCRFCADWTEIDMAASAVWHRPPAREIVHGLKYDGLRPLAAECARAIARTCPRPQARILVPIPLGVRRLRERGYNQAGEIARELSTVWNLPVGERVLQRAKETGTQTALTPEQRLANVQGAFIAESSASPAGLGGEAGLIGAEQGGAAAILVDDVLTTGATLRAAARALQAAGWPSVGAVTFARAMPYELRLDVHPASAHSP